MTNIQGNASGDDTGTGERPVVVAVGPKGCDRGVDFGIRVARLLDAPLLLVHVVEPLIGAPEVAMLAEVDIEAGGREVIEQALRAVRAQAPDIVVSGTVVLGQPVHSLVEHSTDARMIVLEHRDISAWARIVIRSITSGVASRAKIPVVSVPEKWQTRPGVAVTAAVDEPEKGAQIIRYGALVARSLGVALNVINVWQLPTAYQGLLLSAEDDNTLAARSQAEIEELLAGCADDLAGVEVRVQVVRGRAVDALVAASKESSLLVLGRHDPVLPFGSHLGPVARSVFRVAESPVMLVDLH